MLVQYFFPGEVTTEWLFIELALAAALVVLAAVLLTRLADRFADEWGLGKAFVGMLLLATVTSLPEVVAGVTSGAIGAIDMAFGAVYGSCSFNIAIIVIMNLVLAGGGSILRGARPAQLLNSSFGIVMISLSLLAISTVQKFEGHAHVQQTVEIVFCVLIFLTYLACMNLTNRFEQRELAEMGVVHAGKRTMALLIKIILVSLMTIASAWWLTRTGDILADHPIEMIGRPLGRTLVGMCFLAAATSLPEIATSLTAVRMNNLDMALGNVFGSNMFNILVLPLAKIAAFTSGNHLLMWGDNFSDDVNIQAGLLPILLTAMAVASIAYRTQRRVLRLGLDSLFLLLVYIGGMALILTQSAP